VALEWRESAATAVPPGAEFGPPVNDFAGRDIDQLWVIVEANRMRSQRPQDTCRFGKVHSRLPVCVRQ